MNSRIEKRMALRRKLLILRKLTNSKSVKRCSIIMDAFLCIYKLKLQLEALQREYMHLIQHIQDYVKVEKLGKGYHVRVTCNKGPNMLVSILEAIEDMGLYVVQSRVTSNYFFGMEAIVEAHDQDKAMEVRDVTNSLLKAIQKPN